MEIIKGLNGDISITKERDIFKIAIHNVSVEITKKQLFDFISTFFILLEKDNSVTTAGVLEDMLKDIFYSIIERSAK